MKRQHYEFLHLNPDTRSSFKEKKTLKQLVVNRHMSHTFCSYLGWKGIDHFNHEQYGTPPKVNVDTTPPFIGPSQKRPL